MAEKRDLPDPPSDLLRDFVHDLVSTLSTLESGERLLADAVPILVGAYKAYREAGGTEYEIDPWRLKGLDQLAQANLDTASRARDLVSDFSLVRRGESSRVSTTTLAYRSVQGTRTSLISAFGDAYRPLILLADADRSVLERNQTMIESLGCRVHLAGDGFTALKLVSGNIYDLVLMSGDMPELDGWEATRLLRANEAGRPLVPVVGLITGSPESHRERGVMAGMNELFVKPLDQTSFLALLRKYGLSPGVPS